MHQRQVLAGLAGVTGGIAAKPSFADSGAVPEVLCVGVSRYDHIAVLPSAVRDATLMSAAFAGLGFRVTMLIDPTRGEFLRGLAGFRVTSGDAPLTLVYIAAHGRMEGGQSHVILRDARSGGQSVPETVLLQALSDRPRQRVLFLDTCRESPFGRAGGGPVAGRYPAGCHIAYAAQPGAPSMDGENGHSPFAGALQRALEIPGLDIHEICRKVRLDVLSETRGLQIPWERSSLVLPVVLNP